MSFNMDGKLDPDEALRLLDTMAGESSMDFTMLLESKGAVVEGESARKFEDGKKRMAVGGYCYSNDVITPMGGGAKGQVRPSMFIVVRDSDAATASIASLLKNQDTDIVATISVFKAGGDVSKDQQPTLEFVLTDARVHTHALLTGGQPKRPCEVIYFNYRRLDIRSAPQVDTGLRGAVRTCTILKS
jgi:type VI secretion system (T6SS) effector Hcp